MDLSELIETDPLDHGLQDQVYGADDMVALVEWSINNHMYVFITPDGHVHLYENPERPIPLNVVDIRQYQRADDE